MDAGLRDGVTASRAQGYASVIGDLDDGGDGSAARKADLLRHAAMSVANARGSAATTALRGSTAALRTTSSTRCGHGGTYPEQVMFAKGHGAQNDFVLLPDPDGQLSLTPAAVALCDRRQGHGRRRGAAGDEGRGGVGGRPV
jgi:hypothetical protein